MTHQPNEQHITLFNADPNVPGTAHVLNDHCSRVATPWGSVAQMEADTSGTDTNMIDARAAVDKLLTVYTGDDAGISVLLHAATVDERDVSFDASQFIVDDSFGFLYRGTYKGDVVAIKVPKSLDDRERRGLRREAAVMLTLRHPNICRCVAVLRGNASGSKESRDAIIMEYDTDGETLYDALPDMPWKKRLQVLIDVATAVRYLHQQTVVHGDLTAKNVMVGRDRAQLIGFGISHSGSTVLHNTGGNLLGTLEYMAPELLNGHATSASTASDVYSFGLLVLETLTAHTPYGTMGQALVVHWAVSGTRPELQPDLPDCPGYEKAVATVQQLAMQCMCRQPEQRPSASDIYDVLIGDVVSSVSHP